MDLPKLFNAEETAKILGVSPTTLAVWRCCNRYKLQYVKCGRLVRYRESDIADFIKNRTRGGDPETG